MAQYDTQKAKLNRRSTSLRDNLLRRKKAVKSRDVSDGQDSSSDADNQKESDVLSS